MGILQKRKEKLKHTLGIFCKQDSFAVSLNNLYLPFQLSPSYSNMISNKEHQEPLPPPQLLHQQMLIRANHKQSSSSLKWSFHLSSKRMWACFTIPTSHLFQWVWRLSHHPRMIQGTTTCNPSELEPIGQKQ